MSYKMNVIVEHGNNESDADDSRRSAFDELRTEGLRRMNAHVPNKPLRTYVLDSAI
jgi:hypothetical protein